MRYEFVPVALFAFGLTLSFSSPANADNGTLPPGTVVNRTMVVKTGWENELIQKDPSLAHWHWNAMSSMTSSRYNRIPVRPAASGKESVRIQPVSNYPKPNHAPLPFVAHPFAAPPNLVAQGEHKMRSEAKTSLSYSSRRPDAGATSYAQSYQNSAGTFPLHDLAYSSQANVHAKLLGRHM